MGCNTSKESVPPAEAQDKEKQENGDIKVGDNNASNTERSASAKTITLRGSSTPNSPSQAPTATPESDSTSSRAEVKEEEAATKIQAVFRGHRTRKSMKQADKPTTPGEPSQEQLEAEFRADDAELCHAATKIQASFRGHLTRKQVGKDEPNDKKTVKQNNEEEELDIDLADPELNKAAVKIQASFRGHMVRKENEGEDAATNAH